MIFTDLGPLIYKRRYVGNGNQKRTKELSKGFFNDY